MSEPMFRSHARRPAECRHRHGVLRTALIWTAVGLMAMAAFSVGVWVVGLVFHLVGLLFEVVVVVAVAAFVWRVVTGRGHRRFWA